MFIIYNRTWVSLKQEAYAEAYVLLHGPESDWRSSPIDGIAMHKAGGGKKHGRFIIVDGLIDSSMVFGNSSPDDPRPRRRLRTNYDNTNQIEDLQWQLQEEREARERERDEREREKERERQKREREREERTREKEQERKERELEHRERELERIAFEQKSAYFEAALSVSGIIVFGEVKSVRYCIYDPTTNVFIRVGLRFHVDHTFILTSVHVKWIAGDTKKVEH